jgi:hypothetical protein
VYTTMLEDMGGCLTRLPRGEAPKLFARHGATSYSVQEDGDCESTYITGLRNCVHKGYLVHSIEPVYVWRVTGGPPALSARLGNQSSRKKQVAKLIGLG